jgi:isopenicillin-N N-acyltransferase-like protein
LKVNGHNTVPKTIAILRDRGGLKNTDIGMGNEKAINQLIAHHSIVFEPEKLLVWVSTSPWQLGQYVAYDLKKVFALKGMKQDQEIAIDSLAVAPDSFLQTKEFTNFKLFRSIKQRIADGQQINTDSLVASNPQYYNTYILAADYLFKKDQFKKALPFYKTALTKEIATHKEEEHARDQIKLCIQKLSK